MDCQGQAGKCLYAPKCEHACALRVESVLADRDAASRVQLDAIGRAIGYGNAQDILGQLWDEMLTAAYGISGRGQMGVTANESVAYRRGWDDCVKEWANHMKRVAKALAKKSGAA